jgi:hypothetical protein
MAENKERIKRNLKVAVPRISLMRLKWPMFNSQCSFYNNLNLIYNESNRSKTGNKNSVHLIVYF